MNCEEFRELILDHANLPSITQSGDFQSHLESCANCRAAYQYEKKLGECFESIATKPPLKALGERIFKIPQKAASERLTWQKIITGSFSLAIAALVAFFLILPFNKNRLLNDQKKAPNEVFQTSQPSFSNSLTSSSQPIMLALKPDSTKNDLTNPDTVKTEFIKPEIAKAEAMKNEAARAGVLKAETKRADAIKAELAKNEALKVEAMKTEGTKTELAKAGSAKVEAVKFEIAKAQLAKTEPFKAGATKAEETIVNTAKIEISEAEKARAETTKIELAKAGTTKTEIESIHTGKLFGASASSTQIQSGLSSAESFQIAMLNDNEKQKIEDKSGIEPRALRFSEQRKVEAKNLEAKLPRKVIAEPLDQTSNLSSVTKKHSSNKGDAKHLDDLSNDGVKLVMEEPLLKDKSATMNEKREKASFCEKEGKMFQMAGLPPAPSAPPVFSAPPTPSESMAQAPLGVLAPTALSAPPGQQLPSANFVTPPSFTVTNSEGSSTAKGETAKPNDFSENPGSSNSDTFTDSSNFSGTDSSISSIGSAESGGSNLREGSLLSNMNPGSAHPNSKNQKRVFASAAPPPSLIESSSTVHATPENTIQKILQNHQDDVSEGIVPLDDWVLKGWITLKERIRLSPPVGKKWISTNKNHVWSVKLVNDD
ncbi:MAG: hypothetical protein HQM08_17830 [Candidatus Riflebacteria bacterium]|nr:hypothetical protein [Candidatus Riflebacteria bacterium]